MSVCLTFNWQSGLYDVLGGIYVTLGGSFEVVPPTVTKQLNKPTRKGGSEVHRTGPYGLSGTWFLVGRIGISSQHLNNEIIVSSQSENPIFMRFAKCEIDGWCEWTS